jgi:hypothetical protein
MTPPNLKELFGNSYRIAHDPAAVTSAEKNDSWLMQIPCREHGIAIYPHAAAPVIVTSSTLPEPLRRATLTLTAHAQNERQRLPPRQRGSTNDISRRACPMVSGNWE